MGDGAIAMARGDSGDGHQVNAERRDESAGPRSLSLVLRLDVPMQMYACLPAVLALAAARMLRSDGVDARVLWPSGVSVAGTPALLVYAAGGVGALGGGDLPIHLHMRGEHHQPRRDAGNMQVMHVYDAGQATHVLA